MNIGGIIALSASFLLLARFLLKKFYFKTPLLKSNNNNNKYPNKKSDDDHYLPPPSSREGTLYNNNNILNTDLTQEILDKWMKPLASLPVHVDIPRLIRKISVHRYSTSSFTVPLLNSSPSSAFKANTHKTTITTLFSPNLEKFSTEQSESQHVAIKELLVVLSRELEEPQALHANNTNGNNNSLSPSPSSSPSSRSRSNSRSNSNNNNNNNNNNTLNLPQRSPSGSPNNSPKSSPRKFSSSNHPLPQYQQIESKFSEFFDGGGDPSVTLLSFMQKVVGADSKVSRLLKACTQSLIAPAVLKLKFSIGSQFSFKDVRGSWQIRIEFYDASEDNVIKVVHTKKETSYDESPEGSFNFQWSLAIIFTQDLGTLLDSQLTIESIWVSHHMPSDKVSALSGLMMPYMVNLIQLEGQ